MPPRPDALHHLQAGGVELVIDLDSGARAQSWRIDGRELLGALGPDPVEHGMYAMAPWAGRIRDNAVDVDGVAVALPVTYPPWALHGTVLNASASLVRRTTDSRGEMLVAAVDSHPGWPWPAKVELTWQVTPDAVVTVIEVQALGEPFPAVVGWHPWFRRSLGEGGSLDWSLAATGRLVRGEDHLPTGEVAPFDRADGPFDDAFRVPDGRAIVAWPGVLALEIASSGDWYVVFDERADFVCVEPQSGPPDGLGTAPLVTPDRPLRFVTTWTVRRGGTPADRG